MKAVILAAGEGVRLHPFTYTRPKVLLPVAGKPIICHLLDEAKKAGITEAVLVVRHMKENIKEYFSKNDPGIKVAFVEQGAERGTSAALLAARDEINDSFVALAGDSVTESSVIKSVIDAHDGGITLALKKVSNPRSYGVAGLTKGRISFFEEKSSNPKSDLANISIYCMEPTVFNDLKSVTKSPRGEYELTDLLVGARAVVTDGYWNDIGYPWDMLEANEELLRRTPACSGHIESSTISGKLIMGKGSRIVQSYVEGIAYVGENTIIGPNAILKGHNAIGSNCSIGGGTTVKNSILFDNVNAKHLSYIGDSVIGENVNFGSGTQIANYRFDAANINVLTERGWVNTGKKKIGAFVGDNTKFGVLSATMPGKLIGNDCEIHSGVVVNKNVPPGKRAFVRQPVEFADVGEES